MALPSYNVNPGVQAGFGAFGGVPGAISTPPNTYSQTGGVLPALPQLTQAAGANVGTELAGQLSAGTIRQLQQQGAERGVSQGMPFTQGGNTLIGNRYLSSVAGSAEAMAHQGINDYLALLGGIAGTQTSPELSASIADRNATLAAAPNPQAKSQMEQSLFEKYLKNPAGGTGNWGGAPSGIFGIPGVNYGAVPGGSNVQMLPQQGWNS